VLLSSKPKPGARRRRENIEGWPAPGSYNIHDIGAKSAPAHSFTKAPRDKKADEDAMRGDAALSASISRSRGKQRSIAKAIKDESSKPAVSGGGLRPGTSGSSGYSFGGASRFSPAAGGVQGYFEALYRRPMADRLDGHLLARLDQEMRKKGIKIPSPIRRKSRPPQPASLRSGPQGSGTDARAVGSVSRSPISKKPGSGSQSAAGTDIDDATSNPFQPGTMAYKFWANVPVHLRKTGLEATRRKKEQMQSRSGPASG